MYYNIIFIESSRVESSRVRLARESKFERNLTSTPRLRTASRDLLFNLGQSLPELVDDHFRVQHLIEAEQSNTVTPAAGALFLVEHERNTRRDLQAFRLEAGRILGILGEHLQPREGTRGAGGVREWMRG